MATSINNNTSEAEQVGCSRCRCRCRCKAEQVQGQVQQKNMKQLQLLQKWNPPKVPVHDVYHRRGIFKSTPNYEIKTLENTVAIRGEYEDFQLLDKRAIQDHKRKYSYLHFGLVQVAVKPLTATGLNCSVLVCLRDRRCLNFRQSLIEVAQSKLSDGPIYFNCYPDHSVSLTDPHILETLTLSIKTDDLQEGSVVSDHIAVFYKVHYKVLNSFSANSKVSGRKTTFVETNLLRNDKVRVPKAIDKDSFEVPERWNVRGQ